jgi:tripartite-type tricarboxylate transporter receptor subunit TctC
MQKRFTRREFVLSSAGLVATVAPFSASSQSSGNTVLKIMVPFPAGGSADFVARLLAEKLKDELGRPVIVDNRPGAGTRLAPEVLKNSPPDGNTILLSPMDPMIIAPLIYDNLRYNPVKDFVPITDIVGFQFGLAVKGDSPIKNIDQLAQAARKDPSAGNLGVTALGTTLHFLALELLAKAHIQGRLIPYRGGQQMVTEILGGQLASGMDITPTLMEQHRSGKLRVLAVSGQRRADSLPDVPTMGELGHPDLAVSGKYMVYAPARTPREEIAKLNQALRKVIAFPDVRQKLGIAGFDLVPGMTPEETSKFSADAVARWTPVVKASGFKGE